MADLFVSFIVPVYNAERYLAECLNSLLAQDIPQDTFEILCINDGSTDHSREILDAYLSSCPNLTVIHQENAGVVAARNAGLRRARGEFIWFVDADDLVLENVLGKFRALTEAVPCDRVNMKGYAFTDLLTQEELAQAQADTLPCNVPWHDAVVWRSLMRRDFLLKHDLCFRYPGLTHGEDGLFMYEVSSENPRTAELPVTAYFYRVHSGSADTGTSPAAHRRKLRSYVRITEILHGYYTSGRRDANTANKLMTFLWFTLFEAAQLPCGDSAEARRILKRLGLFPGRRLPESTLESAYLTGREGFAGKVMDKLCMNLHTRWGYAAVKTLYCVKQRMG